MPKEKISLYIPKAFLDKINAQAAQEYPRECCGILAGKKGRILKMYPIKNMESSSSSFFMDPEEQYRVFKEIEQENLKLLAIYHSHPHSDAYPSPKDIDLAFYPDTFMIIISLRHSQPPAIGVFKICAGKVKKIKFKIL